MAGGARAGRGAVVRDPLWGTIRLNPDAVRIVDTPPFQRLRYVRQLGLAFLVYPGASHSRFDHALGVYNLARRALRILYESGELGEVDPLDVELTPLAALLHDIGHYPFSHALEELDPALIPGHHEALTGRFLREGAIAETLREIDPTAPERVEAMIRGVSDSPLQGLVAGSLDLDKIEYLKRDAFFCGVPYGAVDVDRLLHSLTLVRGPEGGRLEIGIREKGLSALESLLFSKYQMFRNVYWHHAVRSATVLYKRAVADALTDGLLEAEELVGRTDEEMLSLLAERSSTGGSGAAARLREWWVPDLRGRRLPKRALEVPAAGLPGSHLDAWLPDDHGLVRTVEAHLAAVLGTEPDALFLDFPAKPGMMGLDLVLLRASGETHRLQPEGQAGMIDLPRVAGELYRSARVLRVFTRDRILLDREPLYDVLRRRPEEIREMCESDRP